LFTNSVTATWRLGEDGIHREAVEMELFFGNV
jgi:hypothetical protein